MFSRKFAPLDGDDHLSHSEKCDECQDDICSTQHFQIKKRSWRRPSYMWGSHLSYASIVCRPVDARSGDCGVDSSVRA